MHRLLVLLLVLIPVAGQAADVLENRVAIFGPYTTHYERVQGIPREHVAPLSDAGEVVAVMGYFSSGIYENVKAFSDYGATAADSLDLGANIGTHAHIAQRGDTLYVVGNNYGGLAYKELYRVDVSDIANLATFGSTVTITDSSSVEDDLGAIAFFGGGDSVMVLNRGPDAMNLDYVRSGDKGATWEDPYLTAQAYNSVIRMDLDPMGDSLSAVIFDYSGTFSYDWLMYVPGTGWTGFTTIEEDADFERLYGAVVGKDNTVHVSYMDDETPSHVRYAWRNPDGGAWTTGTLFTADQRVTGSGGLWTAMTYSDSAEVTRIFYTVNDGNIPSALYCKKWDYDTDDWESDSLRISDASSLTVSNLGGCLNVPTSHGDRAYVTFSEQVGANWSTIMATVCDSTGGAAAASSSQAIMIQ